MEVMQKGTHGCVYDFNVDEIINTRKREDLSRILKKIQRCVGVGYEEIWDKIPYNRETITVKELVDIAEKIREERDTLLEKEPTPEAIAAFESFDKLLREPTEDELPF